MSSLNSTYGYVVVGGGIAGMSAARAIRERDRSGSVLLVSEEDRLPYKRTKISKNIAAGFERDAFSMEPRQWYEENGVELLVGDAVEAIDPDEHRAELGSGREIRWRKLILAPGASPVVPEGTGRLGASGVHVVRTASEVERLEEGLRAARRAIVVGSGVLGIEVVDQLRLLDKEVVLVGSTPHPLGRRLNEELSRYLERLLVANGVELLMGERAVVEPAGDGERSAAAARAASERQDGRRTETAASPAVSTRSGRRSGDLLVYCAGVRPNTALARAAGISVGRGILVDEQLRTSHPDVYAAGDAAEHPDGYVSYLWHAAELQGEIAGANAAGDQRRHDCPPFRMKCEAFDNYFFSMNMPLSEEGFTVVTDRDGQRYRALYYRDGTLRGALMANDKERAKVYVRAVREGWSRERTAELIPWAR